MEPILFFCFEPGCEKAYLSKGSLTRHQKMKHSSGQQPASTVPEETEDGEPGAQNICPWCRIMYPNAKAFQEHLKRKHVARNEMRHGREVCPWCNIKYEKIEDLGIHLSLMHKARVATPEELSQRSRSEIAVIARQGGLRLQPCCFCPFCKDQYASLMNLKQHLMICHRATNALAIGCCVCPFDRLEYQSLPELELHLKTFHNAVQECIHTA